jgi:predicted flap endonuclease-1-like 5' DNA nuclease
MLNAPHLLETALLMLAAFLIGAVVGLVLRLLLARPKPAVAAVADTKPAEAPAAPALVTAPEIAPLPVARPTAEQRLAAVAGIKAATEGGMQSAIKMPAHTLPSMPEIASIQPSRTAGETVGGRHIDNPEHPHSASLDDVRAELQAQIEATPTDIPIAPVAVEAPPPATETAVAPAIAEDATIVPAAIAEPDAPLPETSDALAAEAETPMLAEVSDQAAEETLPVEQRIEPAIVAGPLPLMDAPRELAAEIQDVIETPDTDPVPDVVAEAPLVEPVYEKEAEEAAADQLFPAEGKVEPAAPVPEDEMAAMRAIEGGWTPRRPVVTRRPADLPEGVSAAEVAAADQAVVQSGAAVANVTAMVSAVLEEVAPAKPARPAGGFGRPASLPAPRDGRKDDLGQIKGLGPAIESALNGLGIYHYDQVADWDQKAVVWVENHFGFKGRIGRERWQEQARDLSRGRMPVARPVRR